MSKEANKIPEDALVADLFGQTPIDLAIEAIRMFEPKDEPYFLAFSGGKDSVVLLHLAQRAGVKFEVHYADTTIDPPELREFIREHYPDVIWHKPPLGFFALVVKKGLPFKARRWCCDVLKERYGHGRTVLAGIRAEESPARAKRGVVSICYSTGSRVISPLLHWSEAQIWHYIKVHNLPYCKLYDEGERRIGCVVCPFLTSAQRRRSMERWPRYWQALKKAAYLRWQRHAPCRERFPRFEDYWNWWLSGEKQQQDSQTSLLWFV